MMGKRRQLWKHPWSGLELPPPGAYLERDDQVCTHFHPISVRVHQFQMGWDGDFLMIFIFHYTIHLSQLMPRKPVNYYIMGNIRTGTLEE